MPVTRMYMCGYCHRYYYYTCHTLHIISQTGFHTTWTLFLSLSLVFSEDFTVPRRPCVLHVNIHLRARTGAQSVRCLFSSRTHTLFIHKKWKLFDGKATTKMTGNNIERGKEWKDDRSEVHKKSVKKITCSSKMKLGGWYMSPNMKMKMKKMKKKKKFRMKKFNIFS